MELVSVKRTAEDKKKEREAWDKPSTETMDDYPYGLCLHLDAETLEKLGITETDFDAGNSVGIVAEAMITEDAARSVNGKVKRSISLQITKLSVSQAAASVDLSETLYGK